MSLSLSTAGHTSIQKYGIVKGLPVPWHFRKNSIIIIKQTHHPRNCLSGRITSVNASDRAHQLQKFKVPVAFHNAIEQIQPGLELNYNKEKLQRKFSYLFRTEFGGLVKVTVGVSNLKYVVHIEVSSLPGYLNEHDLILSWGMFRSDSSHMYVPDFQTSKFDKSQSTPGTSNDSTEKPFVRNPQGTQTAMLEFDSTEIPFYLSFLLHPAFDHVAADSKIRTHRKTRFCVPVGMSSGHPLPFGVSTTADGAVNFSLFSRNAESVILCLCGNKANQPCLEIELDPYVNRTGDIWHVSMDSAGNYISYGYRCKGEVLSDSRSRFHANQILLDPYAKMIRNFYPEQGESVALVKCLGYIAEKPTFDWSGDVRPQSPMEKLVVYRLNVENFTKDKSSSLPEDVAGTFAGVVDKLQHFISLGVNAVLLEPVFSFDVLKGPYFPYHLFSPMNSYGHTHDGMSAVNSMKEMVRTLHAHGIEVLLEVVFTHTCEGGDAACQTISFRGIDNSSYYIVGGDMGSKSENAVNCNNPVVQQLILESLRYWLTEFHVDGFCFINSSYLLRGPNGDHLSRPPIVETIAFDPILSKTKIIADCWSPVDVSYVDVHFPHWKRWAEMNAIFCRNVRNFLRGEGLLSDLATRLCGSGDLFSDSRGPSFSFNYVTKNFGLTLVDLVSFSSDEHAPELSWNCGVEGPTVKRSVLEMRLRQIRNFLLVLFVSLGVPVLNMGDECGLSTNGSTSCDDRQPMDWDGLKTVFGKQITLFISFLSSLRVRRSDVFQRREFLKVENIQWHGSNLSQPKWKDPSSRFLAVILRAEREEKMSSFDQGDLCICFNGGDLSESAVLPDLEEGYAWLRLVDTSLPFPGFFSSGSDPIMALSTYELKAHSCALFEARKSKL